VSTSLAGAAGALRRLFQEPERPLVAVEVRPGSVGVVRVRRDHGRPVLVAAASLDLPPATLQLSLTQPNILDPARFRQALKGTLERVGVLGGARVALVLPDPVARVSVVPAADVTARKAPEIAELLRFRLKKVLPFEIRDARMNWCTAGGRATDPYLVAAAMEPVVGAYEEACLSLGLEPGLVELAGLALARAAVGGRREGDRLLVNWDDGYVSLILVRGDWPVMVRTLSGPATTSPAEVAREVTNTILYYRERLGGAGLAGGFVRTVAVPPAEAVDALREPMGLEPEVLDPWKLLGAAGPGGSASQLLAAAAACLGADS
jgi:hypothetical protein